MTATAYPAAQNPVIANTNSVVVLGAVARDPEVQLAKNANATKIIRLTVAGEELVVDDQGKTRRLPFYEQGVFLGKAAERIVELGLKAGDAVILDGKFVMRVYNDNDGVERKDLEIRYGAVRRAIGFDKAERSKDAGGALRLVGGFAKASVYGKIVGQGGDLRYTGTGKPVFNFSVNARSSWKDAQDTWQNDAAFVRTTVWGDLAVELGDLGVTKGMEAFVEGRPNRGKFDKDGKTVYTLDITAGRVVIAEGQDSGNGGSGGGRASNASLDSLPDLNSMGFGGLDIDDGQAADEKEELPF